MLIRSVAVYAATFVAVVTVAHSKYKLSRCRNAAPSTKPLRPPVLSRERSGTISERRVRSRRQRGCTSHGTHEHGACSSRSHLTHNGSSTEDGTSGCRRCSVPHRGVTENTPASPRAKRAMHTCLDQYNTNKASNANGGLVWIKRAAAITVSATDTLKVEVEDAVYRRN